MSYEQRIEERTEQARRAYVDSPEVSPWLVGCVGLAGMLVFLGLSWLASHDGAMARKLHRHTYGQAEESVSLPMPPGTPDRG